MKKRILIIEDDHTLRTEISAILTLENFEVKDAPNGEIGLKMLDDFQPDLILCDIMMPVMDGTEVLEKLRNSESNLLTQFVYITALAEKENIRMGMENGADDYLVKPFTREELLRSVNTRLGKASYMDQKVESELNDLREKILSSVPHEMRTPLHAIIGFSQIINEEANRMKLSRIGDLASYIHDSGQQLLKLTNRYNKYVEARASVRNEAVPEINPSSIHFIYEIAKGIAAGFDRGNDLHISLEQAVLQISEEKLKTVISELVENAFKFSISGSPINILGEITGQVYEITITDAGRGMDHLSLKKIGAFQQFERKRYEQQGSGLGLITAHLIIELASGHLEIDSTSGEGTVVNIKLPILCVD